MTPTLKTIIEQMARHHPGSAVDLSAAADGVEALFSELGSEDIGEIIAEAVARAMLTIEQGSWFLGVAVWCGESNGAVLQPTLERWLAEARDPLRIEMALGQDVFPFRTVAEMTHALDKVIDRHPQFAKRCRALIASRVEQRV